MSVEGLAQIHAKSTLLPILSTDVNFSPQCDAPPRADVYRPPDRCTAAAGTARGTVGAGQYTAMRNLDRLRAPGPDSGDGTRMVVGTGRQHAAPRSSGLRSAARGAAFSDDATTGAASGSAIGERGRAPRRRTSYGASAQSHRGGMCHACGASRMKAFIRPNPTVRFGADEADEAKFGGHAGAELTKLTKLITPSSEAAPALSATRRA